MVQRKEDLVFHARDDVTDFRIFVFSYCCPLSTKKKHLLEGPSVEDCPFRVLRTIGQDQTMSRSSRGGQGEVWEPFTTQEDGWMDGCGSSIQGYRHMNMCFFFITKIFAIYILDKSWHGLIKGHA